MNRSPSGPFHAAVAAAILAACAPPQDQPPAATSAEPGPEPEVLISTESAVIGQIADLVLGPDGTSYAVDRQANQVHVVDPSGELRPSIGRPGAGPGEFAQPTTVEVVGDTLFVVDGGNARLQALSLTGEPRLTRAMPPGYPPPSLGAGSRYVLPTWGRDTVLAVAYLPDLSKAAGIGRTVGKPTNVVNPADMKREIRDGTVPTIFLNTAEAVIGPDSSTWLYVPARGTVQRFDAEGRELWSVEIVEPEREGLIAAFMAENAAKPSGAFALLRYVLDVALVGDDAWVLLGHSLTGQAAVRVLSADGTLGERLEFPGVTGVSQIAVDPVRGYVYFVQPDAAQLVRVPWRATH